MNRLARRTSILITSLLLAVSALAFAAAATKPGPTPEDKILAKLPIFPKDDLWNKDISKEPVDPASDALIASAGVNKNLHPDWGSKYGIPFNLVSAKTPTHSVKFEYADESDKGPYPIPNDVKIEGVSWGGENVEGDRHILCLDPDSKKLYELFACHKKDNKWTAGSGAIFDLTKPSYGQRPKGWTSADAAGLPIFPGLVRYDEICINKELTHALRFTVKKTSRAYLPPASHFASKSKDPKLPPMGMRVRLKADFDITPFPEDIQTILKGLKKYGMILADNGSDWFITGATDPRWNDDSLQSLKKVKAKDLEVIKMADLTRG